MATSLDDAPATREVTHQKITPLLFKVPLSAVEDQACVYGDLTASGIAGGLAGEYAGKVCLDILALYNCACKSLLHTRCYPWQLCKDPEQERQRQQQWRLQGE